MASNNLIIPDGQTLTPTLFHRRWSNRGFTLAETLITLVIIGVVAALTVPTMIAKYQKEQTVTRLKKVYSTLSQTTNRAIADYGPIKTWELGETNSGEAAKNFANKYLIPYLQIGKNCELSTTDDCKFVYKSKDGTVNGQYNSSYTKFYLNDGTLIALSIQNMPTLVQASINIDLNGTKKPNVNGKDIFFMKYYLIYPDDPVRNGKLLPMCATCPRPSLINSGCAKNYGYDCMRLIMLDNWQIADDYPSW